MTIEYGRKIKNGLFIGIACAVALHAVMILFGGAFIKSSGKKHSAPQQVELFSQDQDMVVEEKPKEQPIEETEKIPEEKPELEAASLSDIEAELSGQAAIGGDFAAALSFSSSGRVGGKGSAGDSDPAFDKAFSLSEIDQKPRVIFQAAPTYPSGMQKIEGVVSVLFVVDQTGKVANPRIEKSSHKEFEKPAIDAVKQWKFEPAVKAGQRVSCRMRIPIRFQPK
ncbi:MAG: TonB family protein [Kiritimatiellales bacterium]